MTAVKRLLLQLPVSIATLRQGGLDSLSPPVQFTILACGVLLFFGMHNLLQEALMAFPGFEFGVMLGWLEVFGVTVCSFLERNYASSEDATSRIAPLSAYPLLTACLLSSSSLSNMSLNYINYPTKVVFRSCKLIPTMIVATIVHRKIFTAMEYLCAICVCAGLICFAAADWQLTPKFHPIGLAFVTLSVCADSILPNAQERLFRLGSSRLEVTLFTNIFTLIAMTFTTTLSGDLPGLCTLAFFGQKGTNYRLVMYMSIYTFIAYIAISIHMNVVRRFGGVAAVLLATGRKGMTLVLSFLLFPKGFSWFYPLGALLVLGGLLVSSLAKIHNKKSKGASPHNGNKDNKWKRKGSDIRLRESSLSPSISSATEKLEDLDVEQNNHDEMAGKSPSNSINDDHLELHERHRHPLPHNASR